MKDIRNKQLRNKLDKLGIKDVVLNFDNGFVAVWSEDDLTDTILHHADNTIETRIFGDYSVDEWVEMIKYIFDEGLDGYERSKEIQRNSNGHIVIGKQIKEKKDTIHNVNSSKVYDIVTSWMKTHPKDMEILGR